MSARPLISVVIPAYQHGPELPRSLDSIFAQTIKDLEVIVVNDGSTDDTEERVKPYLDRIRYIAQENRGGNAARNRGAAEATGEFIIFYDADIAMRPDGLELMVDALRRHPEAAYAYSSFALGFKKFRLFDFDAELLKKRNYIHCTSLIRRSCFLGFDEQVRRLQDWDLWLTMLENGDRGVFVDEVLFKCLPHHGGISVWVPSLFYKLPLRQLGIHIKNLEKYPPAEAAILAKHGLPVSTGAPAMPKTPVGIFTTALLLFILLELVSFVGFVLPPVNIAAFLIVVSVMVAVSWDRPDIAWLVLVGELVAGSQGGYLLSLPLDGFTVSLRLALFLGFVGAWASHVCADFLKGPEQRRAAFAWWGRMKRRKFISAFQAVCGTIFMGSLGGLINGNGFGNVFFDANGYFYFFLLPAVMVAWRKNTWPRLMAVISAGLVVSLAKSLLVLFVFSHGFYELTFSLYTWIRDTRVGEITRMGGDFHRIFFQSHIFALVALLVALPVILFARHWAWRKGALGVATASLAMIILGLSRSFWVGLAAAALVLLFTLVLVKSGWPVWRRFLWPGLGILFASLALIITAYMMPWPGAGGGTGLGGVLGDRVSSVSDAAARSRWALLPALTKKCLERPILGHGLGTTLTYTTSDPRRVAIDASGTYTTYSFEWGWHDMWLKFGLLGLSAFVAFFLMMARPLVRYLWRHRDQLRRPQPGLAPEQKKAAQALGLLIGLVAIAVTNIFTPYVNHPLGIGLLVIVAGLVDHHEFCEEKDDSSDPTKSE
jgi:hypothetical protein